MSNPLKRQNPNSGEDDNNNRSTKKSKVTCDALYEELLNNFHFDVTKEKILSILESCNYRECLPFSKFDVKNAEKTYWSKIKLSDISLVKAPDGQNVNISMTYINNDGLEKSAPLKPKSPPLPIQFNRMFPFGNYDGEDTSKLSKPEYAIKFPKDASYLMITTEVSDSHGDSLDGNKKYLTETRSFHLWIMCVMYKVCEMVISSANINELLETRKMTNGYWSDMICELLYSSEIPNDIKKNRDIGAIKSALLQCIYNKLIPIIKNKTTLNEETFCMDVEPCSNKLKLTAKVLWIKKGKDGKPLEDEVDVNYDKIGLGGVKIPKAFEDVLSKGAVYNQLIARVAQNPLTIIKGNDLNLPTGSIISIRFTPRLFPYKDKDGWSISSKVMFDSKNLYISYKPITNGNNAIEEHDSHAYDSFLTEDNALTSIVNEQTD